MTKEQKLKAVHDAITDAWFLYKPFCGTRNDDAVAWDELLKRATAIQTRHHNTRLIRGMVMAVLEQLEDDAKEMEHG